MAFMSTVAFAMFAFGFSSPALAVPFALEAPTKNGAIEGGIEARIQGRQTSCLGALLIPRSSAADAEILHTFGSNDGGVHMLDEIGLRSTFGRDVANSSGAVRARCRRYSKTFMFDNVAPGEYYVTALISAPGQFGEASGGVTGSVGAVLMRRINVEAGRELQITLKD